MQTGYSSVQEHNLFYSVYILGDVKCKSSIFFPSYFCVMHCPSQEDVLYKANVTRESQDQIEIFDDPSHHMFISIFSLPPPEHTNCQMSLGLPWVGFVVLQGRVRAFFHISHLFCLCDDWEGPRLQPPHPHPIISCRTAPMQPSHTRSSVIPLSARLTGVL